MEYACAGLEHMGTISFAHSPAGCPGNSSDGWGRTAAKKAGLLPLVLEEPMLLQGPQEWVSYSEVLCLNVAAGTKKDHWVGTAYKPQDPCAL